MSATPDDLNPALLDILAEWEEGHAEGLLSTAEEFCARHPEWATEIRGLVNRLRRVDSLLGFHPEAFGQVPAIPGFEWLGQIGRGGMGVVYRARDLSLGRVVAVKFPQYLARATRLHARFEREARTLDQLRHPGIVTVHAAGVVAGQPYFVMDYVPGGSLAEKMGALSRSPERAADLVEGVAAAMDFAHSRGIVHRDLKPSNVFLDGLNRPLVGDFGLAGLLADDQDDSGSASPTSPTITDTRTRGGVGTPGYSAPEVLFPSGRPVGPTADVWSLGVLLFELLTGRFPFVRERAVVLVPQSEPELRQVMHEAGADIPSGLRDILLRCLAFSPSDRLPSAGEVAARLVRWRRSRAVAKRARKVAVAAVCALAVCAGIAIMVWPPSAEDRHRAIAEPEIARLVGGEEVKLVPASGQPKSFLLRAGGPAVRTGLDADGYFTVDGPQVALVELLPSVPTERYRLTTEVRQEVSANRSEAGIYICHQKVGRSDPEHRFFYLSFADIGEAARTFEDPGTGKKGSCVAMRHYCYAEREPHQGWAKRWLHVPPTYYHEPLPSKGIGPWRRLTLEVSPQAIRYQFEPHQKEFREIRFAQVEAAVKLNFRPLRAGESPPPKRIDPSGGVGLFLYSCKVAIRNCNVKAIENP
jgi:hypothetical protein